MTIDPNELIMTCARVFLFIAARSLPKVKVVSSQELSYIIESFVLTRYFVLKENDNPLCLF